MGNLQDKAILALRKHKNRSLWISWNPTSEIVHITVLHARRKSSICYYVATAEYAISTSFMPLRTSISSRILLFLLLLSTELSILFLLLIFSTSPLDSKHSFCSTFNFPFLPFHRLFSSNFTCLPSTGILYRLSPYFLPVVSYKLSDAIYIMCNRQW